MSKLFSLNRNDILRGVVVSILSASTKFVYDLIANNGLVFSAENLRQLGAVAILAGLGYMIKNLFTDDSGKLVGKW